MQMTNAEIDAARRRKAEAIYRKMAANNKVLGQEYAWLKSYESEQREEEALRAAEAVVKPAAEIKREADGPPPTWVKNYRELVDGLQKHFGISITARQLRNYKRDDSTGVPEQQANGSHNLPGWAEYLQSRNLGSIADTPETQSLKEEQMRLDIEKRRFELEVKRGKYIRKDTVQDVTKSCNGVLLEDLTRRLVNEAPHQLVTMKDVSEIQSLLRTALGQSFEAARRKGDGLNG